MAEEAAVRAAEQGASGPGSRAVPVLKRAEAVMLSCPPDNGALDPETRDFYCRAVRLLDQAKIPFLVGGAYALARYTGIIRHTKDFDIFIRPDDCPRVLALFEAAGYRTELTFPHWLGKVHHNGNFIDVIFSSGNGVAVVDDGWFEHAVPEQVLGEPALLCPSEETIWSKGFVQERERFDGADVAHLLRACGPTLDWRRLLDRYGPHWRVLLQHIVAFGFVYPSERDEVPAWVTRELLGRLEEELRSPPPAGKLCQGTLLSREQYLVDITEWGYQDARLLGESHMTRKDIRRWTKAIDEPEELSAGGPSGENE
jgi:hypothetical protein